MMNEHDWQAVRDALDAGDHADAGEPPTAEELLALERGELSQEDTEHVRRRLIAYPELARAFVTPFPDEAELPPEVIDRQWNAFSGERRIAAASRGRVVLFWHGAAALAAAMAIVFGSMLVRTRAELMLPHVLPEPDILTPDGRRGMDHEPQSTITPSGDSVLLVVSIIGPADYDTYRLELDGGQSGNRIWSSGPLPATNSNSFHVEVPSRILSPGTYQVIAYGLRGNALERIATYTIAVRPPKTR